MLWFCFWGERIFLGVGYSSIFSCTCIRCFRSGDCKSNVSLEPSWLEFWGKKHNKNMKSTKNQKLAALSGFLVALLWFIRSIFASWSSQFHFFFTGKSQNRVIYTHIHACVYLLPWIFFALKITNSATEQLPLCLVFGKNKGEEGADGQRNVSAFTISRLQGERVHLSSPNVSQGYSV